MIPYPVLRFIEAETNIIECIIIISVESNVGFNYIARTAQLLRNIILKRWSLTTKTTPFIANRVGGSPGGRHFFFWQES